MADVFVEENSLKGIANAIRSKNGSSATYTPAEMEQAILDLQIPDVSALDATAADILAPKVAFTADGETEGTIQTKSASDVTVSGDTVSAPAGYYPSAVSKSVQAGSATTPATIIPVEPTISVNNSTGLVTASVNETQAITPAVSEGYVSAGAPGNVRASGSATSQLPIQSAATITPTRSQQTAVAAGKFTTGNVVVDPIPDEYIIPTGTKSITITANGTTTEDVTNYASAQITANVPNTYAASDEGKVVSNGALVSQTSDTVTANDTYDTTLISSLTVNVPSTTLSSISAVYTQSGTVCDTDSIDSLKADLVVTATYSDSSTAIIPGSEYALSGTLTVGTSTITVTFRNKTDTFTVTVSADYHGTKLYGLYDTTLTGSNPVQTSFKLWETDIDFSVLMDLTPDGNSATEQTVFSATKVGSPYNGLKFQTHSGTYKGFGYYSSNPSRVDTGVPTTTATNVKFVITHIAGTKQYIFYSLYNDDLTNVTLTLDFLANTRNLAIGTDSTSGSTRPWYGVINTFEIYNKAWTASEVESAIGYEAPSAATLMSILMGETE